MLSHWRYAVRRCVSVMPVLLGISLTSFILGVVAPGDPAAEALRQQGQPEPTPEELAVMRARLGLDRPLPVQYLHWLGRAVRGDLGRSYMTGQPVAEELLRRLPTTLSVTAVGVGLAGLVGLPLGIWAAVRGRHADTISRAVAVLLASVPSFWLAMLLITILAERWKLLPTSGWGSWRHLVMPGLVLAAAPTGTLIRLVRATMLEVLTQPFVVTATAKGLAWTAVVLKHVLKCALIPVVAVLGSFLTNVVSGSVVVEAIFALPGVGSFAVEGVFRRDYPVIQGYVLCMGITQVVTSFVVDVAYRFLDPRIGTD